MSDDRGVVADLGRAQSALVGRRIVEVIYYGVSSDVEVDWDFDDWHCPVMGVEFLLDDGNRGSAVWDSTFGNFSLHLYASPMSDHLRPECRRWAVHEHPRWKRILTAPITDSQLIWQPDLTDTGEKAPAALRLRFPAGTVWIAAAMLQQDDSWWIGADEIIVAFTQQMATEIGVRDPAR